ncbi:hypothetical protein DT075_37485 [Bacillus licheniformis]|nr:hypothetical protein DT075_37485 [Bacillus licheniformis]
MIEFAGINHFVFGKRVWIDGIDRTGQIRVGGLKARALDEKIPLSHGLIGQETNGAGGMFKALRTIPFMLDIARDIHEICPEAWLINFTNPDIEGIIKRHHQFPVNEIVLVDIEEGKEKLRIVSELAKRMIRHAGVPIELSHTIDRAKALKGADFVTEVSS